MLLGATATATACSSSSTATDATSAGSDAAGSGCPLVDDTTADRAPSSANGCRALLDRDVSSCLAARAAAGVSGAWLKFSCRVTLTTTTVSDIAFVSAAADGQPDYKMSNYFATTSPCYTTYSGDITNPNTLTAHSYVIDFPVTPTGAAATQTWRHRHRRPRPRRRADLRQLRGARRRHLSRGQDVR